MIELATYDLLPTDEFFPVMFNLKDLKPINERFNYLDFISSNFLMNMGSLFLVWLIMLLQTVLYLLTSIKCWKENKCVTRVRNFSSGGLFWTGFIEFLMQAYLEIAFAVII